MSTPHSSGRTALGVAPNVGALLAYLPPVACCAGLLVSVAVIAMEKQNRFLRFHAFQSLLVYGALFAASLVLFLLGLVLGMVADVLSFLMQMMMWIAMLAFTGLQILLMIKAYQGEEFEMPVIGEIARKQV
jgi:uncharacterized membrane protein